MRKRPSAARLEDAWGGAAASSSRQAGSPWRGAGQGGRMPAWQLALLLAGAVAALYVVLSYTNPRTRAAQAMLSRKPSQCYALGDEEAVRTLGPENTAYHRAVATASQRAQALFDLGMLAAHGFNQLEATGWFQACLRADPACAMCHWGLAYAQGPMPNKLPGKLGDKYPTFLPTHASDALLHIQDAQRHNQAGLMASAGGAAPAAAASAVGGDGAGATAAPADGQAAGQRDALLLWERGLIQATAARFSGGAAALKGGKWAGHEAAYASRMQELAEQQQDDPDLFALAAEALMNLTPWDYYEGSGHLKPSAATAEQLLQRALSLAPQHTHALHLHIHVTEAGAPGPAPAAAGAAGTAASGLPSAEALTALAPPNGHLLHMPSHTFVRVGQYRRAVEVNKAAYELDARRGSHCMVPYLPEHNLNMLVYAASMAGMLHTAVGYATGMRTLRQRLPDTWMAKGNEYVNLPAVYIRYGQWPELLALRPPPKDARGVTAWGGRQYAEVVYRAGRMLAMAARASLASQQLLQVDDVTAFDLARKSMALRDKEVAHEHKLLKAAIQAVPAEEVTRPGPPPGMYASAYASLAAVLGRLAEARVALLHNNTAAAAAAASEAVAIEDGLGYMEPPRVHQPLRQCLAWILLHAGRHAEAAGVYEQDLQRVPLNGWSLLGLKQALQATGNTSRLAAVEQQLQEAWADAEVQISSSCPALSEPAAA